MLFVAISAFFMWFGYYSKIRAFSVVGLSILFILSSWIILYTYSGQNVKGLEYRSGINVSTINSTLTVTDYTYATYDDSTTMWVGFLFAIVSAVGIILVAVNDR